MSSCGEGRMGVESGGRESFFVGNDSHMSVSGCSFVPILFVTTVTQTSNLPGQF